jgi:hypothetical protein
LRYATGPVVEQAVVRPKCGDCLVPYRRNQHISKLGRGFGDEPRVSGRESVGLDDLGFGDMGKEDGEDSPVTIGVVRGAQGDTAVVAGDDASGDPEPEAGAVEVFGGVEGLEDAGADGGGHAVAGVCDGDADAFARSGALDGCGDAKRGLIGGAEDLGSG